MLILDFFLCQKVDSRRCLSQFEVASVERLEADDLQYTIYLMCGQPCLASSMFQLPCGLSLLSIMETIDVGVQPLYETYNCN